MFTYICACVCVWAHARTPVCVYVYTHTHVCVCTCIYTYRCTYMHAISRKETYQSVDLQVLPKRPINLSNMYTYTPTILSNMYICTYACTYVHIITEKQTHKLRKETYKFCQRDQSICQMCTHVHMRVHTCTQSRQNRPTNSARDSVKRDLSSTQKIPT